MPSFLLSRTQILATIYGTTFETIAQNTDNCIKGAMNKERFNDDSQNVLHKEAGNVAVGVHSGMSSQADSEVNDGFPNRDKI